MRISFLILLAFTAGCNSQPQTQPVMTQPYTDYNDYGSKFIPEANAFIDYSEDFYSYHYHGRDREPTVEEVVIFEVQKSLEDAKAKGDDERVRSLETSLIALREQCRFKLDELSDQDKKQYDARVRELIATHQSGGDTAAFKK